MSTSVRFFEKRYEKSDLTAGLRGLPTSWVLFLALPNFAFDLGRHFHFRENSDKPRKSGSRDLER